MEMDLDLFESGEELANTDLMSTYIKDKKSYGEWSAPTQSLLQKWLRDVHRNYVYVLPDSIEDENDIKWRHNTILTSTSSLYSTYEEALEAGLYEALTLI